MEAGKRMSKSEVLAIRKLRKAQRQAVNAPATATPPPASIAGASATAKEQPNANSSVCQAKPTNLVPNSGGSLKEAPASVPVIVEAPSNQPPKPKLTGAATTAPLPKGFFDDKKSDALAHGERLRTAKDDAHDMDVFQREVEQLEEQRQNLEAREAESAAERAAALDEFESGQKREQLESLKKRQRIGVSDLQTVELVKTALHAKVAKKGVHMENMSEASSSDDADDSDDDPLNTVKSDWRSKR